MVPDHSRFLLFIGFCIPQFCTMSMCYFNNQNLTLWESVGLGAKWDRFGGTWAKEPSSQTPLSLSQAKGGNSWPLGSRRWRALLPVDRF